VGRQSSAPDLRRLAQRLLAGNDAARADPSPLVGAVVERWQQPVAALVARPVDGRSELGQALLLDALPVLSAVIERDDLLSRNTEAERALVESSERRLSRLGLDLHDGPLQDLTLLAEDLRLFREQISTRLQSSPDHARVLGRMDDLEAQLVAVDADLRRVAASLQSPFLLHQTFAVALRHIADDFEARSGIKPLLTVSGDLASISDSQQMALLAIVREALSNVREHAGATGVTLAVSSQADGARARIADDGRGFDVERTLVHAARGGHLGLVGLHERVRLLGGQTQIDSLPGGPTVISVTLPRWRPVDVEREAAGGASA
jgi:signal transduction histidine kinase